MKRGKRYVEAAKLVDRANLYDAADALAIVKKAAVAKFDETVEVHIRTGCDGRHADQQIRGAVVLPHGTGKTVRILVFAKGPKADEAAAAGADFVGAEELIPKIQNEGWLDFDVVVATPDMMGVVGRLGRVLGPKGLMPNPKAGTVTMDVTKEAINAAMKAAASESFGYNEDPIVSSDVIGMRFGSLFDATQTMVAQIADDLYEVQVVSWYDNENSYTSQMVRTIKYFAELG